MRNEQSGVEITGIIREIFLDGKVDNVVSIRLVKFVPAQSDICSFEVIQLVWAWLVKAERVGTGPSQDGRAQSL